MQNSRKSHLSIFSAFLPMYHLSRMIGVLPLKYVPKASWRYRSKRRVPAFQPSFAAKIYSVLLLTCLMAAFAATFTKAIDSFSVFGRDQVNVAQSEFVSGMVLLPAAITSVVDLHFTATKSRRLCKIFHTISRLDKKLVHPLVPRGVAPNHAWLRGVAVAQMMMVPATILAQTLADYGGLVTGRESFSYLTSFYLLRLVSFVLEQQFVMILIILRDRFELVNQALRDILLSPQLLGSLPTTAIQEANEHRKKKWISSPLSPTWLRLKEIRCAHSALVEETEFVNDTYQMAMLGDILQLFLDVIGRGYFVLDDVVSHGTKFISLFSSAVWFALGFLRIVLVCWVAWSTSNTAIAAQSWILKINEKKVEASVSTELKIFSNYFNLKKVHFNIYGLFNLDMAVVQAVAQASTSYLLVLMQFRQAGN